MYQGRQKVSAPRRRRVVRWLIADSIAPGCALIDAADAPGSPGRLPFVDIPGQWFDREPLAALRSLVDDTLARLADAHDPDGQTQTTGDDRSGTVK